MRVSLLRKSFPLSSPAGSISILPGNGLRSKKAIHHFCRFVYNDIHRVLIATGYHPK